MSADDWWLVAIALGTFLVLGGLGWLRPKYWLWRWADVIYYPLAAIGIVLLFFSNDINRTLLRIEANQRAMDQAWSANPNPRPDLHFSPASAALLDARFRWFVAMRDLGDICQSNTTEGRSAYHEMSEGIHASYGDFPIPAEGDEVGLARAEDRFCKAGLAYVDHMARESLLAMGGYEKVKAALAALAKGGDEDRLKAGLQQAMTADRKIFDSMSNTEEQASAAPNMKVHEEHVIALLGQLNWCVTRGTDNSESLRTLDRWEAEESKRADTRRRIARDLEAARGNRVPSAIQQMSRLVQQQLWPYLLVLALSMKFGKATAGIESDLTRLIRRGRRGWIWLGDRAAALLPRKRSRPSAEDGPAVGPDTRRPPSANDPPSPPT